MGQLVVNMMELVHVYGYDYCGLAVPMMNASQQQLVDNPSLHRISTYRRYTGSQLALVSATTDSMMMTAVGQHALMMTMMTRMK